ncbi:MAG: ATP-dependent helicase [Fidelibacterota bacterium]|nr:MAG: ATP-dependent helicase [Candidatus Neomarinimicrobiota bacterium]
MRHEIAQLPIPTAQQRRAETHPPAPLMILAGAGTGKTTTLIRRIIHLIKHEGIPPEQILALTFSEKAAAELRGRIDAVTGRESTLTATTFHAFCYQVVREFRPEFRSRRLMTDGDILFLLREHYHELDNLQSTAFRREPVVAVKAFKVFFDRLRDNLIQPEQFPDLLAQTGKQLAGETPDEWEETWHQIEDHCAVFPLYQQWKAAEELVDYGDMIYQCWHLLESRPDMLHTLQKRYQTIVVDEFQDNNYALNMVVGRLVEKHHSITVVGDDDQCIYSFRGASAYNIRDFRQRYREVPGYAEMVLDKNHRSTQPILDLANEVIRHNTGRQSKNLQAGHPYRAAPLPELVVGSSAAQAVHLAQVIANMVADRDVPPSDIAVMARTHRQAGEVVAALADNDVPSQYLGNVRFYQIPAIRTALAWCAVAADTPGAPMGLYRLLGEGLGQLVTPLLKDLNRLLNGEKSEKIATLSSLPKTTLDAVVSLAGQISALREENSESDAGRMMWRILVVSGLYRRHIRGGFLEDRVALDNLTLLLETARDFTSRHRDRSLARFVQYMEIMHEASALEARVPELNTTDAVQVMTVHAAKGKEFPVVFIPFLQSARFPINYRRPKVVDAPPPDWHRWQPEPVLDERAAHLEEERRLFYVAITRAERRLAVLTTPKRRSPFVSNLPAELINERALVETEDQQEQDTTDELRTELKQRLSRELARGAYDQAHQLVDAIRLVEEYEAGLSPDFNTHPLGDELRRRLLPDAAESATPAPRPSALTLSASAIGSYETCPLQYRFARVDNIPGRETIPQLTFGRIIHSVLESFHHPDRDEPRPKITDLLEQNWESEGFTYHQEEAQYKEDARKLLAAYQEHLAGKEPPVLAVEHRFTFDLDDVTITGRIDRIDLDEHGRIALIDYKTSQRKLTEKEARHEPQMALYTMYILQADALNGREIAPGGMDLTYYFLRADEPEVTVSFNEEELAEFRQRVAQAAEGIRRRDFPHRKGYHCNYCDYKDLICPAWEHPSGSLREEQG